MNTSLVHRHSLPLNEANQRYSSIDPPLGSRSSKRKNSDHPNSYVELNASATPHDKGSTQNNFYSPHVPPTSTYYLFSRVNKPFTELHRVNAFTKPTPKSPIISDNQSFAFTHKNGKEPGNCSFDPERPLNFLRTKIELDTPTPTSIWKQNASMTHVQDYNPGPLSPAGRAELARQNEATSEVRRYISVGKRVSNQHLMNSGLTSLSSKRRNSTSTRPSKAASMRNTGLSMAPEAQGERPINHRESLSRSSRRNLTTKGISQETMNDFEEKHQTFLKNMKVLDRLAADVSVTHEFVAECIQNYKRGGTYADGGDKEKAHELESVNELILHELGDLLNSKVRSRKLEERLQKSDIETFGGKVTMYLKKIAESLVNQGCLENAMMLMTINKIMAVELEDVYASYVVQLERQRKNPEKDLITELMREKAKNKQLTIMMKLRQAGYKESSYELNEKVARYRQDNRDLEEQLKAKDAYINTLVSHIENGLKAPLPKPNKVERYDHGESPKLRSIKGARKRLSVDFGTTTTENDDDQL